MVSERGFDVLGAIVRDYVATREPVGSKAIVERHRFPVSAATIRHDMAQLEEEELIVAPHTSSGRVPTDKGYRAFVDRLHDTHRLTRAQRQAIERFLHPAADLEDMLFRSVRLLSQLTGQLAVVEQPTRQSLSSARVEIVDVAQGRVLVLLIAENGFVLQRVVGLQIPLADDERQQLASVLSDALAPQVDGPERTLIAAVNEWPPALADARMAESALAVAETVEELLRPAQPARLIVAGAANLVRTGRDFEGSVTPVLEAIEEEVALLRLFSEMAINDGEVATSIGAEHAGELHEASVVAGTYTSAQGQARLGIVGPTRMDYPTNMAAVRAVARYLSQLLHEDA